MVKTLTLFADENSLRIDIAENGWAKLTLVGDKEAYLGADAIEVVALRLMNYLKNGDVLGRASAGEMNGLPVTCLLLLSEAHHALYVASSGSDRLLFWQDARTAPVSLAGIMRLTPPQGRHWVQALDEALRSELTPALAY